MSVGLNSGLFIVVIWSTVVSVAFSKSYYSVYGYASCHSCCPVVDDIQQSPCSSINLQLTKKQEAQIQIVKPRFKQYKKKLLNGKRPNVTVVSFEDDDQIEKILERFGDMFKDKKPDKIPKTTIPKPGKQKPTPKPTPAPTPNPVAQGDDGVQGVPYQAPPWYLDALLKSKPTIKPGSSWKYYSSRSSIRTVKTLPGKVSVTRTIVSGKRKKRAASKPIEVCPRREAWQDLNLALNTEGKLVQIVQLPSKGQNQWILEEVCSKKVSPILPTKVVCGVRSRVVNAVVVPLSGTKNAGEIQVQEIQVHCCAGFFMP
ncbi:uncharacterized protein LOC117113748 [Anneissia japonica]|uniref:uncharacterized protein LOC117113748 n=1 Tax=Anneissia japonica TaxID=1529436 RepID=UPI001425A4F6|nr:uncharacterized protein LOC117113748 [Anneissia japonica]XP_033113082.1 uncharacterized protein LOC117113748 [Anneissia japonica]XP_033113083.1 uncharacterized protein LOC117113748 [Anneissia japonica]XP_033113084.1 uncharacterized protein LOC117113748 [Anneissia japonica]XP_033113085.1 uncharacterized protein LOC117113748 [Anneissia japonica]